MRNFILNRTLFLPLLLLLSCDTRNDFNRNLNTPPLLQIRRDSADFLPLSGYQQVINDSLKLSQGNYYLDYCLSSLEPVRDLTLSIEINGNGFFVNLPGKPVTGYVFNPGGLGYQIINLKATDAYGMSGTATLNLTTFRDIAPVAVLSYVNTAVLDPLEYKISGSSSYDRDSRFGGRIIAYDFAISPSYQVITPYNSVSYIFPASGNYQVSLRVEDNDSVWSPTCEVYISVN